MNIIEINYLQDDVETVDFFLKEILTENSKLGQAYCFSIIGNESDYQHIKCLDFQQYDIEVKGFLFLGKTPYTLDEKLLIYYFYTLSMGSDRFKLATEISNDLKIKNVGEPQECTNDNLSVVIKHLNNIKLSGSKGSLFLIRDDLLHLKLFFEKTYPNIISSCIRSGIVHFINLVDLEIKFHLGSENRSRGLITSTSEIDDFNRFGYRNEIKEYRNILMHFNKADDSNIRKKIDYLKVCSSYSSFNTHDININKLFWLLIWWSSYFLICANYFKKNEQFSTGVSMCVRALELFCKAILLYEGRGNYDGRGRFSCNGKTFSGVGPLWKETLYYLPSNEDYANIWNSIELRNKSVCGHGIIQMNEELYDFVYRSISTVIKNNKQCASGVSINWDTLFKLGRVNLFSGIVESISKSMISSMGIIKAL